jgi:hypothetical protein
MAKIIFEVNYNVLPEKRDDYIEAIQELKELIKEKPIDDYLVLETKNRNQANNFTEIFICEDEEQLGEIEEDETINEKVNTIMENFIVDGKATYSTKIEI